MTTTTDAFRVLHPDTFKSNCVKISRLICEAWIGTKTGQQFRRDILDMPLHEVLKKNGINLPEDYLEVELDTGSFNGLIEPDESNLQKGLVFRWKLPYAPWPSNGIEQEEIENWIKICSQWLEEAGNNPDLSFPVPTNPYIPLATT